jgi:aspartyl aminopeptidase
VIPILATSRPFQSSNDSNKTHIKSLVDKHHTLLLELIKEKLQFSDLSEIYDNELCLVDTQPAQLGGALNEFIFGARLDNQVSAYCSTQALINSCEIENDSK